MARLQEKEELLFVEQKSEDKKMWEKEKKIYSFSVFIKIKSYNLKLAIFLNFTFLKNKSLYLNKNIMGVGGTVLGTLALCLIIALIIEVKERHIN